MISEPVLRGRGEVREERRTRERESNSLGGRIKREEAEKKNESEGKNSSTSLGRN